MKKILLLSVLSIVVVMQSVIAQNNYRDFEFTIDTTGYKFVTSEDYGVGTGPDGFIFAPGITDIDTRYRKEYPDYWEEYDQPALPYEGKMILLPYHRLIDSCVLILHDLSVWKENITLSSTKEFKINPTDTAWWYLPLHAFEKKYPDAVYPVSGKEIRFSNDVCEDLPVSVIYFMPFVYDSFQKTLKIASSVTVRVYYKEGELVYFKMDHLMQYGMDDRIVNPDDLDEFRRQADDPIDEISSGMILSQSGRECTFQFVQPLSENANLYLYKTDGTLYRTIWVEQGATSLTVTLDDPGMYLYCVQNRKGKIIITD